MTTLAPIFMIPREGPSLLHVARKNPKRARCWARCAKQLKQRVTGHWGRNRNLAISNISTTNRGEAKSKPHFLYVLLRIGSFWETGKCPKTLFIALITLMAIHFRRQTSSVSWKKRLPASWHADFPLSQWGRSECGKHVFPSGQRAKGGCLHFAHIRSQWLSTDSSIISQTVGQSFMLLLITQKTDTSLHRWGCPDFFLVTLQLLRYLRLHSHIWKFCQRTNESVVGSVAVCVLTAMRRVKAASRNVSWHLVQDSGDAWHFGGTRFDQ